MSPRFGAAAQHLGDRAVEVPEHLVAAGLEHERVEGLVELEEPLEIALSAEGAHPGRDLQQFAADLGARVARGELRGERLDREAQLGERAQLGALAASGQAPGDDARVVDVPVARRQHARADPPGRGDQAERLEHAQGLADHGSADAELGGHGVREDRVAGREIASDDAGAEGVDHVLVQVPWHVMTIAVWLIV